MRKYLLMTLICFGYCCFSYAAILNSVMMQTSGTQLKVSCALSGPYEYHLFTLSNPERIVIDFRRTQAASYRVLQNIKVKGFVVRIRSGHPAPDTLRLVFEVNRKARIIVPAMQGRHQGALSFVIMPMGQTISTRQPPLAKRAVNRRSQTIMIVIDPGHGGKDPGARGPHGSLEKNVVLGISDKLRTLINHEPGMRAVLTRSGDYYLGLRQRLNIARRNNADVFIAIHADAFVNRHSNGASIFALSQRGATSEAARWLAEKENYSELGGVNLKGLDDRNGLIRTVLIDLSQTATITSSLNLGTAVLRELGKITRLHNQRVEQARFVVLKSPDIPSLLIETGFISNPYEERNLTSQRYQMRLARAILSGLKRYFWEYPLHANPSFSG